MQRIHKALAIISFIFIFLMSLAGIGLGYESVYYRGVYGDYSPYDSVLVGDVMQAVQQNAPNEPIIRIYTPARGVWVVDWQNGDSQTFHPITAVPLYSFEKNGIFEVISSIHTHVFLGKVGKYITVTSSLFLILIIFTGFMRAIKKQGGWRFLLRWNRTDSISGQLHTIGGIIVSVPILILASTGFATGVLYLANIEPSLISQGDFESTPDNTFIGYANMPALQKFRLQDVDEITFPMFDDVYDIITISTNGDSLYFDRYSGVQVGADKQSIFGKTVLILKMLHRTNQNTVWMGIWFIATVAICILGITGGIMYLRRWDKNVYPKQGDIVILYASQNGRTKQFVNALYTGLKTVGIHTVGVRVLGDINKISPHTQWVILMTSTYGDGAPPDMADGVLGKIQKISTIDPSVAVIGFGDKTFANFCGFAKNVYTALQQKQADFIMPPVYIDNASLVAFKDTVQDLGHQLGYDILLNMEQLIPNTAEYTVVDTHIYTNQYGTMFLIKMAIPNKIQFRSGDIFGVVYENAVVRFYSIASSSHTHILTLCVRKIGLVSKYLGGLNKGDIVRGFIRKNPIFYAPNTTPLILLGIGSGVAPLYGIMQENPQAKIQAFFGYTTPQVNPFADLKGDNIHVAYSRTSAKTDVNISPATCIYYNSRITDALRKNADVINGLMAQGAVIMMCGSKDMEQGIMDTLNDILNDTTVLQNKTRLLKDVY